MYKDKAKQKESNRIAAQRRRSKLAVSKGMTDKEPKRYDDQGMTPDIPQAESYPRQKEDVIPCKHPGCKSHVSHPCEGCGRQWGQTKPTFSDLPLDVRQEIDRMCAENNDGDRAGSHYDPACQGDHVPGVLSVHDESVGVA